MEKRAMWLSFTSISAIRIIALLVGVYLLVPHKAFAQTTGSFPYPKWFFSPRDSSLNELKFRMFGYEGMARNLFVLSCRKDIKKPVTVELIPPKGLEQQLMRSASAQEKRTTIRFLDKKENSNRLLFEASGSYDKIAAFMDLSSDTQFFAFLQLIQNEEILVRWDQANFEYLLLLNEIYIREFSKTFGSRLRQAETEELSFQDVYIRCNRLWGR